MARGQEIAQNGRGVPGLGVGKQYARLGGSGPHVEWETISLLYALISMTAADPTLSRRYS